eukprot:TRINITY_DN310_c1_g1_i1.p1 TRINITY_DN310_c1_g1~~TRINITY_DN310_c1_g1_i1.p1  ORF type:complete len:524 (+),score=163.86 TRINITY_DN310_c1_g1_i1:74-1573(+)
MGPILPKPVTSKLLERRHSPICRVGLASTNGYRESQEDAHAILPKEKWGFFGVFDGHCGPLCSQYTSRRFLEVLRSGSVPIPVPDQTLTELCLRFDREFLETGQEGGSTGTFAFVYDTGKGKYRVQVGNVGDSRVILGVQRRRSLPLGAFQSLTDDHKPGNAAERRRIERAGGSVANNRVDGALAVSRAFGDRQYKVGGKGEREHKVIAVPDIKSTDCERGDLLLLCCDGMFESDVFTNKSAISFAWDQLERSAKPEDLASAAAALTDAAIERGSKDNVSVMLVQLGEGGPHGPETELLPGPYAGPCAAPGNAKFRAAYKATCDAAGVSVAQALDMRWSVARAELARRSEATACEGRSCDHSRLEADELRQLLQRLEQPVTASSSKQDMLGRLRRLRKNGQHDLRPCDVQTLEQELSAMRLPDALQQLPVGHKERVAHFTRWLQEQQERGSPAGAGRGVGRGDVSGKVVALQRAGLPLPIIMGLLQQQGRGAPLPGSVP